MSWTYSADFTLTKDKVRFLCGDTNSAAASQLLMDEEINFVTGLAGSVFGMAAIACETIASKFSREADREIGDLAVKLSQKADSYRKQAKELRSRGGVYVVPMGGGISQDAKDTQDDDTDRVRPSFARGQFVNEDAVNDSRYADYKNED